MMITTQKSFTKHDFQNFSIYIFFFIFIKNSYFINFNALKKKNVKKKEPLCLYNKILFKKNDYFNKTKTL